MGASAVQLLCSVALWEEAACWSCGHPFVGHGSIFVLDGCGPEALLCDLAGGLGCWAPGVLLSLLQTIIPVIGDNLQDC